MEKLLSGHGLRSGDPGEDPLDWGLFRTLPTPLLLFNHEDLESSVPLTLLRLHLPSPTVVSETSSVFPT